jgi:hypothetical protein
MGETPILMGVFETNDEYLIPHHVFVRTERWGDIDIFPEGYRDRPWKIIRPLEMRFYIWRIIELDWKVEGIMEEYGKETNSAQNNLLTNEEEGK